MGETANERASRASRDDSRRSLAFSPSSEQESLAEPPRSASLRVAMASASQASSRGSGRIALRRPKVSPSKSKTYRLVTSTTSSLPNATTKESFFPQPRSYIFGASHASSHASQWSHRSCVSLYTSTQTWSVQSSTHRVSNSKARQHSAKQLAHSPHLPTRVCSNFVASLNRGNRMAFPHVADAHAYVSTRLAPCFASSGVGTPGPVGLGASAHPHARHAGASHHSKNSRLNHRSRRSKSASLREISRTRTEPSSARAEPRSFSAARSAARATSASASRFRRATGITASAAARASAFSYASTVRTPPSSRRAKSSRCEDTALADASRRNSSAAAARSSSS